MRHAAGTTLAALILVAALILAACGGGAATTAPTDATQRTVIATPKRERNGTAAGRGEPDRGGRRCQAQLGGFLSSIDGLRRRLAVGVTYEQYVDEVNAVRSTYRRIPVDELAVDCLDAVGAPAEKALNRYIDAANEWGECVSAAGCATAAIEPALQHRWRGASHHLSQAQKELRSVD